MTESKPRLQNIPIRTELGRQLRDTFISSGPTPGGDYASIEKRILDQFKQPGETDEEALNRMFGEDQTP